MKIHSTILASMFVVSLIIPSGINVALAQTASVQIVNFSVNEDYAASNPGWCDSAKEALGYINQIYAKNTSIIFQANSCKTYVLAKRTEAILDESYFYYNPGPTFNFGITIFFTAPMTDAECSQFCSQPSFASLASLYDGPDGSRRRKLNIHLNGNNNTPNSTTRLIDGRDSTIAKYGVAAWNGGLKTMAHEMGHTFAVGVPELYQFGMMKDNSGTLPKLPNWYVYNYAKNDPMGEGSVDDSNVIVFADFNAKLIDRFKNHDWDDFMFGDRKQFFASQAKVTVVDDNNNPIPDATVEIYGVRTSCMECTNDPSVNNVTSPLLKTAQTDASGHFVIDDFNYGRDMVGQSFDGSFMVKLFKVRKGDSSGGNYVTSLHLLRAKQVDNSDIYSVTFHLAQTTISQPVPAPIVEPTPAPVVTVNPVPEPAMSPSSTGVVTQDPVSAPSFTSSVQQYVHPGMLVKRSDITAVYFIDNDNRRHAFATLKDFQSWFPDFSQVVTIPANILSQIPLGSGVTVRPGTFLVKIESDPKVYAVEDYGILRWVTSESLMNGLYGNDWPTRIIDVPVSTFSSYQLGDPIIEMKHPNGSLIRYVGQSFVYEVVNGIKRLVTSASFMGNMYQNRFRILDLSTSITYPDGVEMPAMSLDQLMKLR